MKESKEIKCTEKIVFQYKKGELFCKAVKKKVCDTENKITIKKKCGCNK